MGNTFASCSCCEHRLERVPLIFDAFLILRRLPVRAEVRPRDVLQERESDEEEKQRSEESEGKRNQAKHLQLVPPERKPFEAHGTETSTGRGQSTAREGGYFKFEDEIEEDEMDEDMNEFDPSSEEPPPGEAQTALARSLVSGPPEKPASKDSLPSHTLFTIARNNDSPSQTELINTPLKDESVLPHEKQRLQLSISVSQPTTRKKDYSHRKSLDRESKPFQVPLDEEPEHAANTGSPEHIEPPPEHDNPEVTTPLERTYEQERQPVGQPDNSDSLIDLKKAQSDFLDKELSEQGGEPPQVGTEGGIQLGFAEDSAILPDPFDPQDPDKYEHSNDGSFTSEEIKDDQAAFEAAMRPKSDSEVNTQIDDAIGGILRKQQTLKPQKGQKMNNIDKLILRALTMLTEQSARLIAEKIQIVNTPEYLAEKQKMLNEQARLTKSKRQIAQVEKFEFLKAMNEEELQVTLLALLPIIKLEVQGTQDVTQCKYMVGTESKTIQIKTDRLFIRVGGGYVTLEEHVRQAGPFECIKIYKLMKGQPGKSDGKDFKEAVQFYLTKHKAPDRIIKNYLKVDDDDQLELFENAIMEMKKKQERASELFREQQSKRLSVKQAPRNSMGLAGSPKNTAGTPKSGGLNRGRISPRQGSPRFAGASPTMGGGAAPEGGFPLAGVAGASPRGAQTQGRRSTFGTRANARTTGRQ